MEIFTTEGDLDPLDRLCRAKCSVVQFPEPWKFSVLWLTRVESDLRNVRLALCSYLGDGMFSRLDQNRLGRSCGQQRVCAELERDEFVNSYIFLNG